MSPAPASPDPCRCPLCGQPNHCAMTLASPSPEPCWCVSANFSKALLAQVPPAAQGKCCICAVCAAQASEE
ncbi:MAG: cysteine-rich CWC family protein [Limnohabitans sp.]|nr:cysteine-rich CWC family protein [Limnohabitans sp.]